MKTDNLSCVPKVRFPGFDKPWNYMHGDELFSVSSERNDGSNLPVLALSQNMGAVPRDVIDYNVVVSDSSLNNYKIVRNGDFIISLRSFQGGIEYSSYDGLCSPAYIVLRKRVPMVDSFYKYYFKTSRFIAALNKNLEGIRDGKMVSFRQFSELMIPYPSLDEQQRIASCLSSLDDVIKETERKIESLKKHKKGLMQRLFANQMSSGIGSFGFAKGWMETTLGEICEMAAGRYISASEISSTGTYPCYGGNGLRGYTQKANITGVHPIIGRQGALCGNVLLADGSYYATEHAVVVTNKPVADVIFLYHLLNYLDLNKYATGQAQPGLSVAKMLLVSCQIPTSMVQQQKIASCLSSIDDIITSYEEKLRLLQIHKKGLMQQLFPPMNVNL